MKCKASTKEGARCQHDAFDKWPMCQQHIVASYRAWMKSRGFAKRLEFHVLENEPEIWVEVE